MGRQDRVPGRVSTGTLTEAQSRCFGDGLCRIGFHQKVKAISRQVAREAKEEELMDCEQEQSEKKARSGERLIVRCSLAIANGVQVGGGWVFDVSMRGCLVESPIGVKVGDRLQLRLGLPELPCPLHLCVGGHSSLGSGPSVWRRIYAGRRDVSHVPEEFDRPPGRPVGQGSRLDLRAHFAVQLVKQPLSARGSLGRVGIHIH